MTRRLPCVSVGLMAALFTVGPCGWGPARPAVADPPAAEPVAVPASAAADPPILDTERDRTGPLPAEEAAAGFRVPEGFHVGVFAAEPLVRNPLAGTFDDRGRLWVVENLTYAERPTIFDHRYQDRVVILTDADGDGRADTRTVFAELDGPVMGLALGRRGVFVIAPPRLLFLPDADRDDRPDDRPRTLLVGFDTPPENHHTVANGITWGPDGWLYGRCGASSVGHVRRPDQPAGVAVPLYGGIWRYHVDRKVFEVLCHGTTNPWGLDWTADGEGVFVNTVGDHLYQLIPGAHYGRSHTISPNRFVYEPIAGHADHAHFDVGKGWTDSRGGAGAHDALGGGHAHCGCLIVRNPSWPAEWQGKLLTLNFHGRRINVERLEQDGSGLVARHEPDQFFASDPYFRGLSLVPGLDGAVYILDWSDTGECHENDGVHRNSGRVYRIAYDGPNPAWKTDAESQSRMPEAPETKDGKVIGPHLTRPPEPEPMVPPKRPQQIDEIVPSPAQGAQGQISSLLDLQTAIAKREIQGGQIQAQLDDIPEGALGSVANSLIPHHLFDDAAIGRGATLDQLKAAHAAVDPVFVRAARRELLDRVADGRTSTWNILMPSGGYLVLLDPVENAKTIRRWDVLARRKTREMAWTLHASDQIPQDERRRGLFAEGEMSLILVKTASEVESPVDRVCIIRMGLDNRPIDTVTGVIRANEPPVAPEVMEMLRRFAEDDPSPAVRLAVASAMMRLPRADRLPIAAALLSHEEDAEDHNLPKLIWYGLIPVAIEAPADLAPLAVTAKMPTVRRWIAQAIAEQSVEHPAALAALVREANTAAATPSPPRGEGGRRPDEGRAPADAVTEPDTPLTPSPSPLRGEGERTTSYDRRIDADLAVGLKAGFAGRTRVEPPEGWPTMLERLRAEGSVADKATVDELAVLFGDGRALESVRATALDEKADLAVRRAALETLIRADDAELKPIAVKLLGVKWLNTVAVRALTRFADPAIGPAITGRYRSFHASERPAVVAALTSRPDLAVALLTAVEKGQIPRADLSAATARQVAALGDEAVTARLEAVWGRLRTTPADRAAAITAWEKKLTPDRLAAADATAGRAAFDRVCGTCHRLHGRGQAVGPDLTGADRGNLAYLLTNVLDPSAIVTNDFRVTAFALEDGRTVTGIVTRQTPRALTVRTATEVVTIPTEAIEAKKTLDQSLMPDGVLTPLTEEEAVALFAYLKTP